MRTYDRETFLAAKAAWEAGGFGWRWQGIRRIAAERGFIYPPSGSRHDDREAESPSQRAIIYRALEDNPRELERIVGRSRSWSHVVDQVIGMEERLRLELTEREQIRAWEEEGYPTERDATMSLGDIVERIAASRGLHGPDATQEDIA